MVASWVQGVFEEIVGVHAQEVQLSVQQDLVEHQVYCAGVLAAHLQADEACGVERKLVQAVAVLQGQRERLARQSRL